MTTLLTLDWVSDVASVAEKEMNEDRPTTLVAWVPDGTPGIAHTLYRITIRPEDNCSLEFEDLHKPQGEQKTGAEEQYSLMLAFRAAEWHRVNNKFPEYDDLEPVPVADETMSDESRCFLICDPEIDIFEGDEGEDEDPDDYMTEEWGRSAHQAVRIWARRRNAAQGEAYPYVDEDGVKVNVKDRTSGETFVFHVCGTMRGDFYATQINERAATL